MWFRYRTAQPMKLWIILSSSILFLGSSLSARDKTDVLVMKNGDRMTCEVKGLDAGVLYVSFDYIDGTASVDWSKVARLESDQLFVVKTQDGTVYTGTLRTPETPAGEPVKIKVVETSEHEEAIEQANIVNMIATSDKFWRRFNGVISFGTIYSKGNESTQYSLSSETAYVRERWTAEGAFDSNLSSSTGANVSSRNSFSTVGRHLLPWNNWFYAGLGNVLQSSEQGITLQTALGGGVGRYFKNTNRATVAVLGGVAWQDTRYQQSITPVGRENIGAALIYSEAQFFKFSKTNLEASAALLPALSEPGRVRFNAKATYYVKLFGDLKWNVSFYGSSGLSWTFGVK
jgi:hypothetical protein